MAFNKIVNAPYNVFNAPLINLSVPFDTQSILVAKISILIYRIMLSQNLAPRQPIATLEMLLVTPTPFFSHPFNAASGSFSAD